MTKARNNACRRHIQLDRCKVVARKAVRIWLLHFARAQPAGALAACRKAHALQRRLTRHGPTHSRGPHSQAAGNASVSRPPTAAAAAAAAATGSTITFAAATARTGCGGADAAAALMVLKAHDAVARLGQAGRPTLHGAATPSSACKAG